MSSRGKQTFLEFAFVYMIEIRIGLLVNNQAFKNIHK